MCRRGSFKKLFFVMTAVFLAVMSCMAPVMASEVPEEWGTPKTTYTYDFSKDTFNTDLGHDDVVSDFKTDWTCEFPVGFGGAISSEGERGNFFASNTYFGLKYNQAMEGAYRFALDMKYDQGQYGGFAVRCGIPVRLTVGTPWNISYYETDRYQDNGGKNADTGVGPSGIYVFPMAENQIRIAIKTVEADGSYLAEKQFDIDMGYRVAGHFIRYTVLDTGNEVSVYAGSDLVVRIAYSNAGTYDVFAEDGDEAYYKTAVLYNAAGTEIGSIDGNARIAVKGSIALMQRGDVPGGISYDNILIETYEPVQKPPVTETPGPTNPETNVPTGESGMAAFAAGVILFVSLTLYGKARFAVRQARHWVEERRL